VKDDDAVALVDVAARMEASFAGGLQAQLQWMEDAALALDAAGVDDAATNMKAALGAVAHWARGPQDPATLPELEGVVRTLTTSAQVGMYRALADALRTMADARTPQRSLCLDLAGVFASLARSIERGDPPPKDALERLSRARDLLESPSG
jgi:hypothetical protein